MNTIITTIPMSAVLAADTASGEVSKTAAIIVMLIAFTVAFAVSGVLTYRIRMKKNNQPNLPEQEEAHDHDYKC
ncbi:MAG: hypothetical protein PUB97_09715 [Ruminococcus sp.]|nr:hypothetical protein [Ruminococcus sp.]